MRVVPLSLAAFLVLGCVYASQEQVPASLSAMPLHADGIYALQEKAGWTITGTGRVHYQARRNNAVPITSGELDLSGGSVKLEVGSSEPAMIYVELQPPGGKPLALGAAIDPTSLKPEPAPRDFDVFWERKLRELRSVPENPVLTPGDSGKPGVDYATIRMDHINATHVYGQIAKPSKPGKYPAMLILQWASPPYRLWPAWVADPALRGWLALNIEPHDVLPTEPQSYYDNLPAALKSYNSINMEDRERSYFVEMYLRGVRAVDYLTKRSDWDGKTLLVIGTSMGGQQGLAVAGLQPRVTHLMVNVPAGCDLNAAIRRRSEGYPFLPWTNTKAMDVARYIDCVNLAAHIKATTLVAMGFIDTACPPAGVWMAFNQIKAPKEVAPMPESPHNHLATSAQLRPWTERSAAWLEALEHGRPVPLAGMR